MDRPTLPARRYLWVDRVTKMLALALLSMALVPEFWPEISWLLGLAGVAVGVVTVVIRPAEDEPSETSTTTQ
ncbi:hypothetical protein [Halococcoides cellulosivorans]|uniref:DUF8120 domain-containing protein n=1 Tax=Halococcoides cellulosivorans TaxID=1679096 RepID=A0A2R4X0Z2_9EURY|nr:hypothetical protein [Halococcoides cellulosivorans]AWB27464.1 hypothetical protein HARCEL1_06965 [Halococcoides cellulosivorans]